MLSCKKKAISILNMAGIELNGGNPWDIQVHNEKLYERTFKRGSLAFGEAYMDGWWSVERLDLFFEKIFAKNLDEMIKPSAILPYVIKAFFLNLQ